MKNKIILAVAACILLATLSGCTSIPSSSVALSGSAAPSVSTPASQPASSTTSASQAASASASVPAVEPGAYDVHAVLDLLAEAAGLGATIDVMQLDLEASGIDVANIVEFAGYESVISSENGGIVVVVRAVPGTAETVQTEFATFRDTRINGDYAEFAVAMANTKDARIVVHGDYVVYAVSTTGAEGYPALDAAIAAAFA